MSTFSLLSVLLTMALTYYAVSRACRFTAIERHRLAVRTVGVIAGVFFAAAWWAQLAQGNHHYLAVRDFWGIAYSAGAICVFFCFQIITQAAVSGRRHLPLERRDPDKRQPPSWKERHDVAGT